MGLTWSSEPESLSLDFSSLDLSSLDFSSLDFGSESCFAPESAFPAVGLLVTVTPDPPWEPEDWVCSEVCAWSGALSETMKNAKAAMPMTAIAATTTATMVPTLGPDRRGAGWAAGAGTAPWADG